MSKKGKTYQPTSTKRVVKPSQKARRQNQNNRWVILGFAMIAILAVLFLTQPKSTQSKDITVAQANQKIQQNAFILDVRTQEEFDQSRIAGSTLIPLEELQNRLGELPTDREMVVYCRTGRRSQEAISILQKSGYSNVYNLSGGFLAWEAAGYPVENGNP